MSPLLAIQEVDKKRKRKSSYGVVSCQRAEEYMM